MNQFTNAGPVTRSTLLIRLRDVSDHEAWEEFVADYGPQILAWCGRQGLQEADCADVVQDVLIRLVTAMRTFTYDPSRGRFRSWLKTVTQHAVADFVRFHQRAGAGSGDSAVGRILAAVESPETIHDLSEVLMQQAELEMLREAEARVRVRVKPQNWAAWNLTVREQQKAPEVAAQLQINVSDVYVARSRINKMIHEELRRMEGRRNPAD